MTDVTKVFIKVDGLSGKRLESILEIDFNIEVESASDIGVLILCNLGNSHSDFKYLADSSLRFQISCRFFRKNRLRRIQRYLLFGKTQTYADA